MKRSENQMLTRDKPPEFIHPLYDNGPNIRARGYIDPQYNNYSENRPRGYIEPQFHAVESGVRKGYVDPNYPPNNDYRFK